MGGVACRGQKKVMGPLELELEVVMSGVLGTEFIL